MNTKLYYMYQAKSLYGRLLYGYISDKHLWSNQGENVIIWRKKINDDPHDDPHEIYLIFSKTLCNLGNNTTIQYAEIPVGHGKKYGFTFFLKSKKPVLGWKKNIFRSYSIIKISKLVCHILGIYIS